MLRAFCLAMTILLLPLGYASADAPLDLGDNAALKYWQAFAQLPKFTDAQEHKLNAEFLTMPLDAARTGNRDQGRLRVADDAPSGSVPRCDWGLGYEEGIELLLPHAQAARTLATLACLRARIRFEDGHNAERHRRYRRRHDPGPARLDGRQPHHRASRLRDRSTARAKRSRSTCPSSSAERSRA